MKLAPLVLVALLAGCATLPTERDDAEQAPSWIVGDWWTYRFSSQVYDQAFEATLVVAAANATGFVIGMPSDAYEVNAILFHMPPTGGLARDLSYGVHDATYAPLRFPLVDGGTWETQWAAAKLKLTSKRDGEVWRVTNEGDPTAEVRRIDLVYDPAIGWFREHQRAFGDGRVLERVELVASGHGYPGKVRALDGIRVVLLESRSAGLLEAGAPSAPTATFTLPADVDALMVACVYGGAPGRYQATILAPDGSEACAHGGTVQPGDALVHPAAREVKAAPGQWEARLVALGQGSATAEALAYRSWET